MPHTIAARTARFAIRSLLFALLILLILLVVPRIAAATPPSLALAWTDCLQGAGTSTLSFGCAANTVQFDLFGSFSVGARVDSVVAVEGVIDIMTQFDPVPGWWQFQPGACHEGALVAYTPASSACLDPWAGNGVAQVQAYRISPETPATNRARLVFTVAVLPSQTVSVAAGQTFHAVDLRISSRGTIGTGACSGCASTACLVFNSLLLKHPPGSQLTDTVVSDPGSTTNWAYWQGITGVDCAAVPVRARTWGAIKSLYR